MKKINGAALRSLINSVHLNGIINEAVLQVSKKEALINAIDPTNCLLVSVCKELDVEDFTIGITELGLVVKILNNENEVKYELSESGEKQFMKLKIQGVGTIKLLLTHPDLIPTNIDDKESVTGLIESYDPGAVVSKDKQSKLMYFLELLKPTSVIIKLDQKGNVSVSTNKHSSKQFNIKVANFEPEAYKEIEIEIYTDHLLSVLKNVETDSELEICMQQGQPVVLTQKDWDLVWAFSPVSNEETE